MSYYTLAEKAPAVLTRYRHPAFIDFLSRLVGAPVMPCPEDDPHACALYFYTEPGDDCSGVGLAPPTAIGLPQDTAAWRDASGNPLQQGGDERDLAHEPRRWPGTTTPAESLGLDRPG